MTMPVPRSRRQRTLDTMRRLENDVDLWLASGGVTPYLVPLSFDWDGTALLVATPSTSPTGRNLAENPTVRLALGTTRDVVMIDATAEAIRPADLAAGVGESFAARTGFDPRVSAGPYLYYRLRPSRIQAWCEEPELRGRELMADGVWLEPISSTVDG